ncbi:MAG: hypothetical protein EP330_24535 [Deltaproteobacteria bacterium]|nr:MAG: hypothetical protein EP330_24535 [Deltaproteobacteria bacterium]
MSDPFAPPDEVHESGAGPVVAGWMLAFGGLGAAVGALLVMLGIAGHMAWGALPGAVIGAGLGITAHRVEAGRAAQRTAVIDARGRAVRPLGTWLIALPLAVGACALVALVGIGALYADNRGIGVGFGLLALGLVALFRPLYAASRLRAAVESASRGEQADEALRRVATAWWSTSSTRAQAALNLGLLALRRGEYEAAGRWYASVQGGRAQGFAATGLALVYIGMERYAEAEGALREAATSDAGRHVQAELDGARLLLVLRTEGPDATRELAARLEPPSPGALFSAVRTAAQLDGSDESLFAAAGARQALAEAGLAHLVPELR